ncbi:virulence factor MviM [Luteimicrobium album]|uniref:Virulence factor MviM n=1 Tax=Luteimicrobium album TaxID=1054550 RepID=A0ABQ6HYI4_9MICO|nr:Gfo/Idh/MocA family oxidoreductase [Luteimicrobium album]GMA22549.1 virulence factor MviM [Luteimicrobium album]
MGFVAVSPTVEEAVAAHELDALFVLTPRSAHAHAVEVALAAGLDVFCEKPLAPTTAEAARLADLAEAANRVLMVGFNRRFAPTYVAGHEAFGRGGARICVAQKNRAGSEYRATFENAVHMVDLLRWYCGGEVESVSARAYGDDPWQEEGLSAHVRFANGNTGVLVAARDAGAWSERLDAHGGGVSVHVEAPDVVAVTRDGATSVRSMSPEAFGWATATETFGFAAAVRHFLDRVRDRGEPLTSGREAVRTQELLDMILTEAGLPTTEQPGRVWRSRARR